MNAGSWETLLTSTVNVSLLITSGIIPYQEKINNQQESKAIVDNVVDEILLNETQKAISAREAPAFLNSDYDENDLYQVKRTSLE